MDKLTAAANTPSNNQTNTLSSTDVLPMTNATIKPSIHAKTTMTPSDTGLDPCTNVPPTLLMSQSLTRVISMPKPNGQCPGFNQWFSTITDWHLTKIDNLQHHFQQLYQIVNQLCTILIVHVTCISLATNNTSPTFHHQTHTLHYQSNTPTSQVPPAPLYANLDHHNSSTKDCPATHDATPATNTAIKMISQPDSSSPICSPPTSIANPNLLGISCQLSFYLWRMIITHHNSSHIASMDPLKQPSITNDSPLPQQFS